MHNIGVDQTDGDIVTLAEHVPDSAIIRIEAEDLPDTEAFVWHIEHKSAQIAVEGIEAYRTTVAAVLCNNYMLCPESIFALNVKTGEKLRLDEALDIQTRAKEQKTLY